MYLFMYKCNIVLEETHVFQNTPCDVSLQRPFNGFGENNALPLRKMHQEEKKKKHRGGHWTLSEDLKLKELVAVFGPQNWKFIGEKMEPRTSLSCRQRWFNQLDPKINKRNFTDEEEEKLLRAHILYGNKWSKIAKLFNRRTDHAVKNHWHSLMNRIIRKQSASDIRSFDNIQNYQTSNFLPGLCLLNTKQ
ncbi:putative transcription factor MYB-HB-like family [Arabidopsis thaliana]|uniref:Myb domain protein 89 n=4 Tax=Arabidopsis TaxID=3701 RepID=Q9SPG4_ARATH|nr:myb domain protein 89 [Arabidopsis thaliana]AAD53100.1 putative transcription factor [Arabidopsis thaliana]AED94465.1 myb domain protein 89 [Arabidopsis thaliana]OAO90918.1 MYB89 [Arabidopsis thaliana]BAB08902.1 transcription factor [Arabidopsis thaliana]|eukprot:NP_568569.1 myb domain protein 89 [Arabidopsis thaliana]